MMTSLLRGTPNTILILSIALIGATWMCASTAFAEALIDREIDAPMHPMHAFEKTKSIHALMLDNRIEQDLAVETIAISQQETSKDNKTKTNQLMQSAMDASNFSGEATKGDLWALKAGLLAGSLPYTQNTNPEMHNAALSWLSENLAPADKLNTFVANALRDNVKAAQDKKSTDELAVLQSRLFGLTWGKTTLSGLTPDHPDYRLHGYLLAGVWAARAHQGALYGKAADVTLDFGQALKRIFEQDAIEDGTDLKIAAQLAAINDAIQKEKPDTDAIVEAIAEMSTIAGGQGDK